MRRRGGRRRPHRRRELRGTTIAFVLWHDGVGDGWDRCSILPLVDGSALSGTARLPALGPSAQAGYRIEVGTDWAVRRAVVRGAADVNQPEEADVELVRMSGEGWTRDGEPAPEFDGCLDVALGFSPAALTATVRRLALEVGERRAVDVVRIAANAVDVTRVTQHLERVEHDRYRHDPGDGREVLVHLGPQGLVAEVEDAWKAVALG